MKIKICGLTDKSEAQYLNENKIDFAGFVLFFPKSKRNNTIESAKEIMACLSPSIQKVAVVVSPGVNEIRQIEAGGFDFVQIHGTLSDEVLAQCRLPILRAFNVTNMAEYDNCLQNPGIAGYVFDAAEPGSGQVFDWSLAKKLPRDDKLFALAGGLCPDNVADAINALHPDMVDVSSGVEYTDRAGKDPKKIADFAKKVRATAF